METKDDFIICPIKIVCFGWLQRNSKETAEKFVKIWWFKFLCVTLRYINARGRPRNRSLSLPFLVTRNVTIVTIRNRPAFKA